MLVVVISLSNILPTASTTANIFIALALNGIVFVTCPITATAAVKMLNHSVFDFHHGLQVMSAPRLGGLAAPIEQAAAKQRSRQE